MQKSCFDNSTTANHLIATKKAFHLPPDYDEVMDIMDWWGRTISPKWHGTILEVFYFDLSDKKNKVNRESLFKQCISERVVEMLEVLTINAWVVPWIYQRWSYFFDETYNKETRDFFGCCVKSIRFVRDNIEHK